MWTMKPIAIEEKVRAKHAHKNNNDDDILNCKKAELAEMEKTSTLLTEQTVCGVSGEL